MFIYKNASRGKLQYVDYAKQLISYDGMRFPGRTGLYDVTPTDIDGFLQFDRYNCFIFIELKHNGDLPDGQENALIKTVDAIQRGGAESALFVAIHNTPAKEMVNARDAVISKTYWKRTWYIHHGDKTLYEAIRQFLDYVERRGHG